jgi:dephospho-CoA kinase
MESVKIVGIGGLPRSGKDTLAELFIEDGFYGVSFGDILREFARERHHDKPDPISVANMTETSNWLRETQGADVILKEALRQFEEKQKVGNDYKGMVLWSIRAPVEVDFILAHKGDMIWVEASDEVRHKRSLTHLRVGEAPTTLEEFKRQEALQWKPQPDVPIEVQMDLSYVKDYATHTLVNNDDNLDVFLQKSEKLINIIGR